MSSQNATDTLSIFMLNLRVVRYTLQTFTTLIYASVVIGYRNNHNIRFWRTAKDMWDKITEGCFATIAAWITIGVAYWCLAFMLWNYKAFVIGWIKGAYILSSDVATLFDPFVDTDEGFKILEEKRARRVKWCVIIQVLVFVLIIASVFLVSWYAAKKIWLLNNA